MAQNRERPFRIKQFHDRITHADCFSFDIDLFKMEVDSSDLRTCAKSAFENAETIAENTVRHLHSQPDKVGR